MYCLTQAGRIVNYYHKNNLAPNWYRQLIHTAGLWKHKWCLLTFSLVVDDFGVKSTGKQHTDHLIESTRRLPCGYWLDWWPVLCYQTILEPWSDKKNWPLHTKVCPWRPPWIPTLIWKNNPTCTTQLVTPTRWTKITIDQRGNLIKYSIIT